MKSRNTESLYLPTKLVVSYVSKKAILQNNAITQQNQLYQIQSIVTNYQKHQNSQLILSNSYPENYK